MANEEAVVCITIEAGGDLSAGQFKFVTLANDGQVDLTASAGGEAIGVLQNKPSAAGRAATVAVYGVTKVIAGDTVAAGAKVQSDASGLAITAASAGHVLGVAITGGAVNEVISILLLSHHILA
jgi:hypothetical protein